MCSRQVQRNSGGRSFSTLDLAPFPTEKSRICDPNFVRIRVPFNSPIISLLILDHSYLGPRHVQPPPFASRPGFLRSRTSLAFYTPFPTRGEGEQHALPSSLPSCIN